MSSSRRTCSWPSGVPFLSDADLESALEETGVTGAAASAIVDENAKARLRALRAALAVIALVAGAALFFSGAHPDAAAGGGRYPAGRRPVRSRARTFSPHMIRPVSVKPYRR